MIKNIPFILLLFNITCIYGQAFQNIEFNKEYADLSVGKSNDLSYKIHLEKRGLYAV